MDENELKQLEFQAAAIDANLTAEFTQPEQAKQPSLNEQYKPAILKVLNTGIGFGNSLFPFTNQFFGDQAKEDIADNIINVADVENIDLKAVFGDENSRIGAWIGLAISLGVPSFMWFMAFKEYKKHIASTETKQPAQQEKSPINDHGALMPAAELS